MAVKVLEKNKIQGEADVRRVTREIDILKRNRHPNIVRLLDVLDTPSRIYLVMEDCNGCVARAGRSWAPNNPPSDYHA